MKDLEKQELFMSWLYNVHDKFKNNTQEEIKEHIKQTAHPFAVCFENIVGDFNMATGIRNANAFNAREVFYIGQKRFNRRGAVGTYHYTPVNYISQEELIALKSKYTFVAVDNIPGAIPIKDVKYPENTLFIFGEEGKGLSEESQKLCDMLVEIPMYGSVRSINVGTASGIIMNDFVQKM
jgi:tRNA G18 (ribose-2'-O)-methylase SpoU